IGHSIINSGYRANPEPREEFKKRYAIAKSPVLPSFTFSVGDRDPKRDVFLERMKIARERIKDGADPHITLGIHSWQDDEARARLGKYIDEVKSGEFWYCNENDYAAYRTQTLHAKIKKFGVSGKTAVFELRRPPATTLGSDIPLSIVFGKAPKAVFLGKTQIMPENGEYKIAHYENWKTPKKIDLINFSKSAGQMLESKKFPGLEFAFSFDREAGRIFLSAGGPGFSKVSGFRAKWVVPPFYEAPIDGLLHKGGGKLSARLKPFKGAQKWGYSPDDGNMLVMAECNFVYEGKPARVWLALTDPRGVAKADCARDRALHLGAFDGAKNDFAAFAKFSDPNNALEDFEGLKWQIKSSPAFREFTVNFNGFSSEYRKYLKSKFSYLVCADFVAPRDGKYDFLTAYHCVGALFVNGEKVKPSYKKITLKKGVNRVLMVLNNEALRINTPLFAVSDGGSLLKTLTPKTR
ncbi:MAG: hypothetical protein IJI37_06540, partial [Opitutales bacterium]|nr:hypothetical protein [Opitutales bacterium]